MAGQLLPSLRRNSKRRIFAQIAAVTRRRCAAKSRVRQALAVLPPACQRRADVSQGLGDGFTEWTSRTLGAVSHPPCLMASSAVPTDYLFGLMTNVTMDCDSK